ncbi:PRC-barrel domain-containing protein [Nereida sp. MMG025]|uniref:PRC-barrel domain-containing protein n=1 Tax=Nereida sp. MMG025 TaxID=2909981 RepID=UPI001F4306F2|nr:PRC-barrel domain-containing protein [Nereida sp. MMG025]MCF6445859.1 PRC-barrel domain-containing protein [Nereida sp. MMG025]
MTVFLSTLPNYTARIETTDFPVQDSVICMPDQRLAYLLIDISPWQDDQLALMSSTHIQSADHAAQHITLGADLADIAAAPKFTDLAQVFLDKLPPIIVGPFGNTLSPLMMAAAISPTTDAPDVDEIDTARHHRFSALRGMDVYGKDGQLGWISDFILSKDDLSIQFLVLSTKSQLRTQRHVVPAQKFRHFAQQATHVVLDITSQDLADAPQLQVDDMPSRDWLRALHAYYRLSV